MSKEQSNVSKHSHRKKVWNYMMDNDLVNFPSVVYHRIPNFKGADEAAKRLAELEEFKKARVLKVNPDKPQEPVRLLALEAGKEILVPIPRLKSGLFFHVVPVTPNGAATPTQQNLKAMATRFGIETHGKPVGIDADIKVDLVVLGSVCVSREGFRIGKGEGFADLEFAMMMRMKAVDDNTVVVTTVHDCQLVDKFEEGLFERHDVPVDIIITPTQTIFVSEKEGKDVILKADEPNNSKPRRFEKNWKRTKGKKNLKVKKDSEIKLITENNEKENENKNETTKAEEEKKEVKKNRRRRRPQKQTDKIDTGKNEEKTDKPKENKGRKLKPKPQIDFSLKLSNIGSDVRVRDLKSALSQRGISPTSIAWRGQRGFCYLHFGKLRGKNNTRNEPVQVDSIVANLQQLYVGNNGNHGGDSNITNDKFIIVEPAKPITRIETTDVSAV
ncbi:Similar to MTHFSD: Methenyltetrahydrofolate synthase domain-containing protein (Bos taurus) [Cotesia congregata]|uniref:Methenyltetrahydrofolate synthase domain-containing protein n=1 Tax=Cotesia congregata TaxID=51543 RepID=A0A8J2EL86_COTCN|nr:Similar to MTHFSD: Methenyltetrahydrofolate synthase domain-containing protein (Bos taurus) [Cotesia congregata]